ncbi:MAG: hypothetical protein AAF738_02455, partial [Bacteroidota bacterium]
IIWQFSEKKISGNTIKTRNSSSISTNEPLELTIRYRRSLDGNTIFFNYFKGDEDEPFFTAEGSDGYRHLDEERGYSCDSGLSIYEIEAYSLKHGSPYLSRTIGN